jgi:hypothetical protein
MRTEIFRIMAGRCLLGLFAFRTALGQGDLVFVGANVQTMDPDRPTAEAVVLADGRITLPGCPAALRGGKDASRRVPICV